MQTTTAELGKLKQIKYISRGLYGTILASVLFVLSFTFIPVIIASASATTVGSLVQWSEVDIEFDPDVAATSAAADPDTEKASATHGNIDFGDVTPSVRNASKNQYGTMMVHKKTLGVKSTVGKYYTVYLSMTDTIQTGENTTVANNGKLNLQENGYSVVSSTLGIPATTGTWDTPKTVSTSNANGWGYMVPGTTVKQSDGTSTSYFSDSTVNSYIYSQATATNVLDGVAGTAAISGTAMTSNDDGNAYSQSMWAGVPAYANAQQIWKNKSNTGFATQDTFNIYYGVVVDSDVMSGTYQNSVVYSVLASAESLDQASTHLERSAEFVTGGTVETLKFDLAGVNWAGIIDKDDIEVAVVPFGTIGSDAELEAQSTTLDAKLKTLNFSDYPECAIDNSSTFTVDTYATVTCTMPATTVSGITVADSTTSWTGSYDLWLRVSGYNYNFVTRGGTGGDKPAIAYAGLQSTDGNGNKYVTKMQEMTAGVCEQTNRWDNGLGTNAKLYTATASTATADTGTEITAGVTVGTTADGIGSFALKDTRDGKRYVVRRLADGNCWMAQNLNLDLYTGMTLTSEDTNLTARDTWVIADSANSNNETTLSADTSAAWVEDAGSISKAWQTSHGVETVTLKKYTYDGSEWHSTIIAQCTGGTQQAPCYATTTGNTYYKDVAGVETAVTAEIAKTDGYTNTGSGNPGSPVRGFNAGVYYGKVTYQVRKVTNALGSTWASKNVGYSATEENVTDNSATCTFGFYRDKLQSTSACVLETEGETMLTQFDNIGMNGYGMGVTKITKAADDTTIDFMNNTGNLTANLMEQNGNDTVVWPFATNAGDYRWHRQGRDGVHVHDWGPVYYNFTQSSPTAQPSYANSNGTNCANIGTVSGSLTLSGSTLSFTSCMDGNGAGAEALADTRVDGNWYNWYAAVAGSKITNFGNSGNDYYQAPDSICPKGWQLPKDVGDDEATAGTLIQPSWYTLITKHTDKLATFLGIDQTDAAKRTYYIPNNNDSDLDSTRTDYPIHAFPLSYVRSGVYYWNSGGLDRRGSYGYYWSATTYNANTSRSLNFYASGLNPRGGDYKGRGFAVRCVAIN